MMLMVLIFWILLSNCCEEALESAKFTSANKNLGHVTFGKLQTLLSAKVNLLFGVPKHNPQCPRQICLQKYFLKIVTLVTQVFNEVNFPI